MEKLMVEYLIYITVLKIIKVKQLDVGTYIFNTNNYEEYINETKELKQEYKLTKEEYLILKKAFKEKI